MSRPLYAQFFPGLLLLATAMVCMDKFSPFPQRPHGSDVLPALAYVVHVAGGLWFLTALVYTGLQRFIKSMPPAPAPDVSSSLSPVSGD
jgi:hypothetical protein